MLITAFPCILVLRVIDSWLKYTPVAHYCIPKFVFSVYQMYSDLKHAHAAVDVSSLHV
jgi:hypothetical protein